MDRDPLLPHRFSYQFDFHALQDSAGQYVMTFPYSQDLDQANKLKRATYESVRLFH